MEALEALPHLAFPNLNSEPKGNISPVLVHLAKNDQNLPKGG